MEIATSTLEKPGPRSENGRMVPNVPAVGFTIYEGCGIEPLGIVRRGAGEEVLVVSRDSSDDIRTTGIPRGSLVDLEPEMSCLRF